jgi:hypothetical protein
LCVFQWTSAQTHTSYADSTQPKKNIKFKCKIKAKTKIEQEKPSGNLIKRIERVCSENIPGAVDSPADDQGIS